MEKAIFYPFLMFVFSITMVGGWIPTIKLWSQETFRLVISFCAGILLGAVFFHVLPEISTVLGRQLGYSVMFGFLLIFILEKFIMVHPCEEGECDYHKIGVAAYVGIGFHSILDGIAIGAGTMMNLSFIIILAVTIHKFPAALALSSLLVKGKEYSKKKILLSMFIFALATPVGALVSVFIFQGVDDYVKTKERWKIIKEYFKSKNIGVVASSIVRDKAAWKKFIVDFKIGSWVNGIDIHLNPQTGKEEYYTDFRNTFDVYSTPVVYVLDQQKKIVGKRIPVENLKEFIQYLETRRK